MKKLELSQETLMNLQSLDIELSEVKDIKIVDVEPDGSRKRMTILFKDRLMREPRIFTITKVAQYETGQKKD